MPQTVRLREDLGIVEVRSYGRVTAEDFVSSRESVAELCEKHGIDLFMEGHKLDEARQALREYYALEEGERL